MRFNQAQEKNDVIKRLGKHKMYDASAGITWQIQKFIANFL